MVHRMKRTSREQQDRTLRRDARMRFLSAALMLATLFVVVRLGFLQVVRGGNYSKAAEDQRVASIQLSPERGEILAYHYRGGVASADPVPIASNHKLHFVFADPREVIEPSTTADMLAPLFGEDARVLHARLSKKDDPFEPLKHLVDDATMEAVYGLALPGIYDVREDSRFYPAGPAFAHVSGFLGIVGDERKGQYGIEGYWDRELAGAGGMRSMELDASGRMIATGKQVLEPPLDGDDIVLTIDATAQEELCSQLYAAGERYLAETGSLVVMEPFSGEVRVMCSYPTFDPNNYRDVTSIRSYLNHAVSTAYEPGSVFKAITMAAGLDAGRVDPKSTFIDEGFVTIGPDTIRNALKRTYGEQTMTQVLEFSINTGVIHVMRSAGRDTFKSYVERFGFGEATGIELPAEALGTLNSLDQKSEIYYATASFGQGITVTPIQLARAFSAIANGGILPYPTIVSHWITPDGSMVRPQRTEGKRVISAETSMTLGAMLVSVVKNGQAKRAQVPGYYVAGKTGTAELASISGKGYSDSTAHTFVGFTPIDRPRFVMVVQFMRPQKGRFADSTTAPTFSEMAKFLLQYYQVPPDFETES